MNLILYSVTTFAIFDYFHHFMRFVTHESAEFVNFFFFYSKDGLDLLLDAIIPSLMNFDPINDLIKTFVDHIGLFKLKKFTKR